MSENIPISLGGSEITEPIEESSKNVAKSEEPKTESEDPKTEEVTKSEEAKTETLEDQIRQQLEEIKALKQDLLERNKQLEALTQGLGYQREVTPAMTAERFGLEYLKKLKGYKKED